MKIKTLKKKPHLSPPNAGIALTELIVTLPVGFILLAGITKLSFDMQSGIKMETTALNSGLHSDQIPKHLRKASSWPLLSSKEASQALASSSTTPIFSEAWGETLCRGQLKSLTSPIGLFTPHSENTHIRSRLEELRWLSISAQRSACLLEGSSRLGPQAGAPLLLAAGQLPTEALREQAHLALCPVVARGGFKLRQGVALGVRAAELQDTANTQRAYSSLLPRCP